MKYKALFLDVDGTIIPYDIPMGVGLPSEKVAEAVRKASKKLTVCLATGRPFFLLEHFLDQLGMIEGYAVINDGAQVMELGTKKIVYERVMKKSDITKAVEILRKSKVEFIVNDNERDLEINNSYKPYRPYNIFTRASYSESSVRKIRKEISSLAGLKVNITHAGIGDRYGLLISHAEATKLHGIFKIQKLLKIKRAQTIGVGDSGNDFSLLMASGLKVAMGNAIPSLKDIADYIAPSVDEDGVAHVIEKFVLNVDKTG